MGGGGGDHGHAHGDFRNKVWSMTGGPYCRPKHWKRNTAIAMVGVVLICIPIAIKSAELEIRGFDLAAHDYMLMIDCFYHAIPYLAIVAEVGRIDNYGLNVRANDYIFKFESANCNDHTTLFAPSLLNSGARTLELKTINNPESSIPSLVWVFTPCQTIYLLNAETENMNSFEELLLLM
ncbi:product protein [Spatholobus suberectus]|nr:product protein [Spatholobus suberectus]